MGITVTATTIVILAILVAVARSRAGRVVGIPGTLTEPPEDIHPAELAVLWGSFRRSSPLLAATGFFDPRTQRALYQTELLHLAQQGVLEMQAIGSVSEPQDIRVRLRKQPAPMDAGFVQFLFSGSTEGRTLKEVAGFADRGAFGAWAGTLRAKVLSEMVSTTMRGSGSPAASLAGMMQWAMRTWMPLSRQTRGWPARAAGIVAFVGAIAVIAANAADFGILDPGPLSWILPIVCFLAGGVATRFMPYQLPFAFRERLGRWASFRRFLVTHADMDDAPALAVAVWEKYLVYASALQAADEVEQQVRQVLPMSMMVLPWLGAPGGIAAATWVQSFAAWAPQPVRMRVPMTPVAPRLEA